MKSPLPTNTKKKYWILFTHFSCPFCNYEKHYQERVYNKEESGHEYWTDEDHARSCLEN